MADSPLPQDRQLDSCISWGSGESEFVCQPGEKGIGVPKIESRVFVHEGGRWRDVLRSKRRADRFLQPSPTPLWIRPCLHVDHIIAASNLFVYMAYLFLVTFLFIIFKLTLYCFFFGRVFAQLLLNKNELGLNPSYVCSRCQPPPCRRSIQEAA